MLQRRAVVVFVLLVLILVGASMLFGLLTYWLSAEVPPAVTPDEGRPAPQPEGDRSGRTFGTGEALGSPLAAVDSGLSIGDGR